jgi:hypothetical protein
MLHQTTLSFLFQMSARIPCTIYAALCKGTVVFIVSHDMFLEHLLDGALGACVTPPTPPGQRYFDNAILISQLRATPCYSPITPQRGPRAPCRPAALRACTHSRFRCRAAHTMSARVQGIKPLGCASFTAVEQLSSTSPLPPQPRKCFTAVELFA